MDVIWAGRNSGPQKTTALWFVTCGAMPIPVMSTAESAKLIADSQRYRAEAGVAVVEDLEEVVASLA